MKPKFVIIIVVVALVVAVAIIFKIVGKGPYINKKSPVAQTVQTAVPAFVSVATIPDAQVPKGFPSDFPFENGVKVLQNSEIKDPVTRKTQSTRAFVSQKTVGDNWSLYRGYIKSNGWSVISSTDQPAIKNFHATKGGAVLDVTVAKDQSGQATITAVYVH